MAVTAIVASSYCSKQRLISSSSSFCPHRVSKARTPLVQSSRGSIATSSSSRFVGEKLFLAGGVSHSIRECSLWRNLIFVPPRDVSVLGDSEACLASPHGKVYIVHLGGHYYEKDSTTEDSNQATNFHQEFLQYFFESKEKAKQAIVYSFTKHINAFAAYLDEEQVAQISKHPDVISVVPNKLMQLHTTRTWDFVGLERNGIVPPDSISTKENYGKDVIIANLDTGVWPESASFSDDGNGEIPGK